MNEYRVFLPDGTRHVLDADRVIFPGDGTAAALFVNHAPDGGDQPVFVAAFSSYAAIARSPRGGQS